MFASKASVCVGITTFYNECLGISVPGLAKLGRNVFLIIYNDNPESRVCRRQIRKMGYRGPLHIINGTAQVGQLQARLEILRAIKNMGLDAKWFVFADDDDILVDVTVPNVGENNFAIMQNMVVMRTRLVDVLRVMHNSANYVVDNENVCLVRPHMGLAGTLVRMDYVFQMADLLEKCMGDIAEIDAGLGVRPPVDMMMWAALNLVARQSNEFATPIYMDRVNYIATDIDTAREKYGMRIPCGKNAATQMRRAIEKYVRVFRRAMATDVATGHDIAQETEKL